MIKAVSLGFALLSAVFSTCGAYLLKRAAQRFSWRRPISVQFVASGFSYVTATMLFVMALKFDNLSIVYPIAAVQYLFISLIGIFVFNEQFTRLKAVGIALIILGVGLINA